MNLISNFNFNEHNIYDNVKQLIVLFITNMRENIPPNCKNQIEQNIKRWITIDKKEFGKVLIKYMEQNRNRLKIEACMFIDITDFINYHFDEFTGFENNKYTTADNKSVGKKLTGYSWCEENGY